MKRNRKRSNTDINFEQATTDILQSRNKILLQVVEDLEEQLEDEKKLHDSTYKCLQDKFKENDNLRKLLRAVILIAAMIQETNSYSKTDDNIEFAFKYANINYLKQLALLIPQDYTIEEIGKIERYREKLIKEIELENEGTEELELDDEHAPFSWEEC